MNREWNKLILNMMLKDETLSPLRRYFIWEKLRELEIKNGKNKNIRTVWWNRCM